MGNDLLSEVKSISFTYFGLQVCVNRLKLLNVGIVIAKWDCVYE